MGVHHLWSILSPIQESVPLYSLTGKTLAVDLSLWVCEAQHVQAMMGKVTKPHLRNLFFRVSSLTLMGVKLVFVMEGEAPKVKAETMSKRTDLRFGGLKKSAPKKNTTKSINRGRFNAVLRECAEMLDCLGIPWVTAAGEAEAMCAFLDAQGLVDGCITNDGDAFLYGARTVYRNFNMNTKDPQVNCYRTCRVETELHLSRETLVGLAILLGCDYIPKGIPGVGKEQALKLIQTLKGQTLLQRFSQWREEGVGVPEGVVKKVPHCHLCRHPGSAKAHERRGCVLCNSTHFCEPQDYDYECPCDWHHYEQTRQASSTDANIRKKTLESDHFPFTEIINEFLVNKDKLDHNFKRRRPNLLLMQNFAFEKMDWPKHYTSEKVLVLMTYTELMNRKHGRETSSQITPLRIWKPRVRNSVVCFEIIWRKPDHYVFPEDHPKDSQDEVRTVEEEALFRLAYPDVVELYLKEKAEAEENKTKKKKPRSKKEKPSDPCDDGVSDLLAQMSLHSSTPDIEDQQPSGRTAAQATITMMPTNDSVVVLEDPKSLKQHIDPGADHPHLEVCLGAHVQEMLSSPGSSGSIPNPVVSSPSISMVMDALHLSDIDWESPSFTSSPSPQASSVHPGANPKSTPITDDSFKERVQSLQQGPFSERCPTEVVPGSCFAEHSLRDRILMKNTQTFVNIAHNDVSQSPPLEADDSNNCGPKPMALIPIKSRKDPKPSKQPLVCGKKAPLVDKSRIIALTCEPHLAQRSSNAVSIIPTQHGSVTSTKQASVTPTQPASVTPTQPASVTPTQPVLITSTRPGSVTAHNAGEPKPSQKYRFVKNTVASYSALPQRTRSEPAYTQPGPGNRNVKSHQAAKKSVCAHVCSSSEDSEAENRQRGAGRRRVKVKPKSNSTYHKLNDYSLKPTATKKPAWDTATAYILRPTVLQTTAQPIRPRAVSASVGQQQTLGNSVSSKGKCPNVQPITVDNNTVFIPRPASPAPVSDGDDTETCSNSPLPLVERLRLKFLN
ncbi:flap endonuclease GEN homolog 1 [Esox lucius]|uniref:flap endonuclease GEN homolog 1 n=1 Tax=Esox lucius TaxID=8010 RepID=UPI0010BD3E98|nr:flap endonuclease GEN homolog 1 [Esox lucius]